MTAKCSAEGGKIVEVIDDKCSSCGKEIYYRRKRTNFIKVRSK